MKKSLGILSIGIVIASMTSLSISDRIKDAVVKETPVISKRTKATYEEKKENKRIAKDFAWAGYGWKGKQWDCISKLFTAESRFDHFADNPKSTAYGIGQVLGEKSSVPEIQILRAYQYIKHRYTTPCNAWNFHIKRNYY
jgi:hypothetical protein